MAHWVNELPRFEIVCPAQNFMKSGLSPVCPVEPSGRTVCL